MDAPLRVLIVEDSVADAELLVRELERGGYAVAYERVQTAPALQEALTRAAWDVVVSDYDMPMFSGPAALGILQATGLDIPFIMISGTIGEDIAVSALKAGAHDFLVKGRLARLMPAIERERREVEVRRERTRAEDALRRSEAHYRSLFDGAIFGIYQATAEGHFVTVNPALVTMLGYDSAHDLLGVGWAPLHDDPDVAASLIRRSHEGAPLAGEEVIWRRKSGDQIRVRLSGRLIEEPHTRRTLAEVIVEDITEQHRLQEQWRQAQKMEAIGQLAGGVAHDFNNLLTVILGNCELLLSDLDPDHPHQRDIAEIQKAGASAAGLTRQLLAFSRKEIIEPMRLDLNVVVGDMRTMLNRLIREDVTVVFDFRSELAPMKADRGQVEQIVLNLAVNARDAMPRGGTLTIGTANVELDEHDAKTHVSVKPGPYVALTVSDTGTGMTSQVQERLFEPFFTTKEVGKGTGLGLATVHGIVTGIGGSVTVASEVGRGTSFTVYFPRADAAELLVDAPPLVAGPRTGTETVLVVDDADGLRELARRLLQRQGYTVLVAANTDDALRLCEGNASIDVLLTDVVMPGASGPELTRRLVERRPALKVIYMSGYTEDAIVHHGVLNAGIAFLHKPFTSDTLGRKIREVLDRPLPRTNGRLLIP
jgi:PAS domain S-box-containing protein